MSTELTPMQAISAKCKECIYDEGALGAGAWRQQVEDCTAPDCSLLHLRPLTTTTLAVRKAERLANMSPEELARYQKKADVARAMVAKHRGLDEQEKAL